MAKPAKPEGMEILPMTEAKTHKVIRKFTVEITQERETDWNDNVIGALEDTSPFSYFPTTLTVLKSDVTICCFDPNGADRLDVVLTLPKGDTTNKLISRWMGV